MSKEILRKVKEEKGITLIALIITIIVLLILAGITLSMILGPNGIIQTATEARDKTEEAALNEQLMFNKVDDFLEEQLKSELAEETETQKSIKIVFNSGENKTITLPTPEKEFNVEGGYTVDWGDETQNGESITYTYAEVNKEYTVTISGTCTGIKVKYYGGIKPESIIEIEQWGSTGLTNVKLTDCINLRRIASPTKNSFVNVDSFFETFSGCSSLTSIPSNLFANCPNVTTSWGTFTDCNNLTGEPIKLWEEGRAGITETTGGEGCYANCTKLNRFEQIPEHWITLPKPS